MGEPPAFPASALSFGYRIDESSVSSAEHGLALFRQGQLGRALPLLQQGAAEGERRAQYVLATALFNGDGVERDVAAAFRWMRRARDAGLAQAADSLAEMERLVPEQEREGTGAPLLSPGTIDACRSLISQWVRPVDAGSLGEMVRAMVAVELRVRLDDLVPQALDRSLPRTGR